MVIEYIICRYAHSKIYKDFSQNQSERIFSISSNSYHGMALLWDLPALPCTHIWRSIISKMPCTVVY